MAALAQASVDGGPLHYLRAQIFVACVRVSGAAKGKSTEFPAHSCFRVIEDDPTITVLGSTLVCGDDQDEVFDYLEISAKANEPRLRWLHAKVQKRTKGKKAVPMSSRGGSLSASALQEVVGQAIKNLAFLRRDASDPTLATEIARWTGNCSLPVPSAIRRVRRGASPGAKVKKIVANPLALHEVAIVIPTYSKSTLQTEFALIQSGGAAQTTVQLFWLLSGFMQACLEVGVTPLILLRD